MNNLVEALNAMEHRLQGLIEGSLAKIFSQAASEKSFAHRLVQALPQQLSQDQNGHYTAPHTIILRTAPEISSYLRNHPGLIEEISEQIELAALGAGIYFEQPPLLRVKSDQNLQNGDIQFEFTSESSRPGTTAVLPTAPGTRQTIHPQNAYLIIEGKELYPLTQAVVNLGRHPDNHIVIHDRRVSRQHAQVRFTRNRFVIFDLQSSGGTYVNNQRIHQSPLRPGDVISLAGVLLVFGEEQPENLTKTQEFRANREENKRSWNEPDE